MPWELGTGGSVGESIHVRELFRSGVDRESVGFGVIEPVGDDFVFVYVNPTLEALESFLPMRGKRLSEVWPGQRSFISTLTRVLETNEPALAENVPLDTSARDNEQPTRYFTFEISPLEIHGRSYLIELVWAVTPEVLAQPLIAEADPNRRRMDNEVEDAGRLEGERQGQEQTSQDLETMRQILAGTRTLAGMLELPKLLDHVATTLSAITNGGRVILNLWDPDREEFLVTASAGRGSAPIGLVFSFQRFSTVTREAVAGKRTVVVDYDPVPAEQKRYPLELGMRQALFVPLMDRGEFVGFVSLDDPDNRHEFSQREKEVAEGIAAQAATAITNARLVEAVRESARLEHSMAEITAELASSLDIEETLPRVLDKMCTTLRCRGASVADRVSGGWQIRHVVGLEGTPFRTGHFIPDGETPSANEVLRTKQPYVCSSCSADDTLGDDMAWLGESQGYALHPLIVRDHVIGLLTVFFAVPQTLSPSKLDYVQRIAFATSLAEENSRLYEAEHRIAETLQTGLLALPERLPGVEFVHLYRSATETARVGGDFYDLIELEPGMVGIVVGDMSGHGVDAAVLTSLVKNAIRIQAMQVDMKPNQVIATANTVLYQNSAPEMFATVFFGILYLDTGRLEYCNAGHTTGVLLRDNGEIRTLTGNGPLVGAFDDQEFGLSIESVEVGDLLFLYTDGLTEARHDRQQFGEDRLFALLERERADQAEATVRHVLDNVLDFVRGQLTDDVAILTLRRAGKWTRE